MQAKRDIKRVNDQEREEARGWNEARERLEREVKDARDKVVRLEEAVDALKMEAERLEKPEPEP